MKKIILAAALFGSLAALAACGNTPGDRAVSGAGIGAGVGAVSGALMGNPFLGAAVGAGVGGAVGGLTSPGAIDLGTPIWR